MAKSQFYFHLMMVTVSHMLKTHGFSRSSTRPLEVLTDIATRFMNLLVLTVLKYMRQRNSLEPNVEDIARAFVELKVIFPVKRVDPYDVDPTTDVGIQAFERWFNGDANAKMRKVARPDHKSLETRRETRRKMNGVNYRMHDLAKMLDQQNREAQLLNPTLPYGPGAANATTGSGSAVGGASAGAAEALGKEMQFSNNVIDNDWIQFLLRDQITDQVMTQRLKIRASDSLSEQKPTAFKGTVLADYIPQDLQQYVRGEQKANSDFIIKGPLPENLMHTFPYYKSEDEDDEDEEDDENQGQGENGADMMDVDANSQFTEFEYFEHDVAFDDAPQPGSNLDLFS